MSLRLCNTVLRRAIPAELTEQNVLEDCLTHLSRAMPDGQQAEDEELTLVEASILLLAYLWATKGLDGAQLAQRCPLLTREGIIVHHTAKKIVAPVAAWAEEAHPFADIYLRLRALADVYCERSPGGIEIVEALVEWDIAFRELLFRRKSNEVGDQVLAALSDGKDDVTGITVKDETFSQVALFNTDVIQRCQESIELATLLFGFVLRYLASADHSWREFRSVIGKCKGKDVPIRIRDPLWLAELKRRSWVPMRAEGGKTRVGASQASLTTLLQDKMAYPK